MPESGGPRPRDGAGGIAQAGRHAPDRGAPARSGRAPREASGPTGRAAEARRQSRLAPERRGARFRRKAGRIRAADPSRGPAAPAGARMLRARPDEAVSDLDCRIRIRRQSACARACQPRKTFGSVAVCPALKTGRRGSLPPPRRAPQRAKSGRARGRAWTLCSKKSWWTCSPSA